MKKFKSTLIQFFHHIIPFASRTNPGVEKKGRFFRPFFLTQSVSAREQGERPKGSQGILIPLWPGGAQALLFRFGIQIQLLDRNTNIGQLWYTMNF